MRRTGIKKAPKVVNAAQACLEDTLRLLLDVARQAHEDAGSTRTPFDLGRAEALAESLHTWANQLRTFGLKQSLGPLGNELREYLEERGLDAGE